MDGWIGGEGREEGGRGEEYRGCGWSADRGGNRIYGVDLDWGRPIDDWRFCLDISASDSGNRMDRLNEQLYVWMYGCMYVHETHSIHSFSFLPSFLPSSMYVYIYVCMYVCTYVLNLPMYISQSTYLYSVPPPPSPPPPEYQCSRHTIPYHTVKHHITSSYLILTRSVFSPLGCTLPSTPFHKV